LAKECSKLLEIIHGEHNRPISVPSKYPETMLTNIILGNGYFGVVFMGKDKEFSQQFSFKPLQSRRTDKWQQRCSQSDQE
jgi:hypothetical protein